MKGRWLILMAAATSSLATSALACRMFPVPSGVATRAEAAVIVSVFAAEPVGKVVEWQPWKARGRLVRVVAGSPLKTAFAFENSGDSSTCDTQFAVPRPGERWVLYLWRSRAGEWLVSEAFPVAFMRRHDPRLSSER